MTRSLQATLPFDQGADARSVLARFAAAVRSELQGWIAASQGTSVPAHAKQSLRAQRLMRSW